MFATVDVHSPPELGSRFGAQHVVQGLKVLLQNGVSNSQRVYTISNNAVCKLVSAATKEVFLVLSKSTHAAELLIALVDKFTHFEL